MIHACHYSLARISHTPAAPGSPRRTSQLPASLACQLVSKGAWHLPIHKPTLACTSHWRHASARAVHLERRPQREARPRVAARRRQLQRRRAAVVRGGAAGGLHHERKRQHLVQHAQLGRRGCADGVDEHAASLARRAARRTFRRMGTWHSPVLHPGPTPQQMRSMAPCREAPTPYQQEED